MMFAKGFGSMLKIPVLCLALSLLSPAAVCGAGPDQMQTEGSWVLGADSRWYYCGADGAFKTGWIEVSGKYYYLYEDGHCAMGEVTPDGYRVDENGAWYEVKKEILGVTFSVPARFVPAGVSGNGWTASKDALASLKGKLEAAFGKERLLAIENDGVEYRERQTEAGKSRTTYLGLYKDYGTNGYRLDIRVRLEPDSIDEKRAATYDYAVFTALLSSVSSSPDQLAEAIVSSWQDQNTYGVSRTAYVAVGDCEVKFEAGDGYGKYFIRPHS